MKHATILLALVATIVGALVSAQAAYTDDGHRGRDGKNEQLVFVQTNELDGNQIVVFERERDGSLEREATYATGGRGGAAAPARCRTCWRLKARSPSTPRVRCSSPSTRAATPSPSSV